jgi:hypothetical protein
MPLRGVASPRRRAAWRGVEERAEPNEQHLLAVVVVLSLVAATVWVMRAHQRQITGVSVPLPLPTTGLVPLDLVAGALVLPATAGTLAFPWPGLPRLAIGNPEALLMLSVAATIVAGVVAAQRFVPAADLEALTAVLAPGPPPKQGWRRSVRFALAVATGRSMLLLVFALFAGTLLGAVHGVPELPCAYAVITGTAIVLDLAGELRARRARPSLTTVFLLHRPVDAEAVLSALARAGIPAVATGLCHRTLLQALGPVVPVRVAVPTARRADARAAVEPLRPILGARLIGF